MSAVAPAMSPVVGGQDAKATHISAALNASFDQDFKLYYLQQAVLRTAGRTELAVAVADLSYSFCPSNAYCLVADFVAPKLSVADAQGRTQVVSLPVLSAPRNAAWLDTTSIRANGRRYLLYYKSWSVRAGVARPAKTDISAIFRVTKPARN